MAISNSLRKKLVTQALAEIADARQDKEGRISQWHATEDQYFGKKGPMVLNKSNVLIPKMQGFHDTLLSKVKVPPNLKYVKGEESDLKKARRMNALWQQDSKPTTGNWPMKDLMAKSQGIMYGRAIFEYHADSVRKIGYKSHLSNTDVYDFLIDGGAGGVDIENALHLGRKGIEKTKSQLEQGRDSDLYDKGEVNRLLKNSEGSANDDNDAAAKDNRYIAIAKGGKVKRNRGTYAFWEWYTTYQGQRYYLLLNEDKKIAIRAAELEELFEDGMWPFATWATNPNLTEFWTPGPCDYVRDIFLAQSVNVNQMLDNAEAINDPMKAVNVNSIDDPNMLNYRRGGIVPFKAGVDFNKDLYIFKPQELTQPITLYNLLENIHQTESGVTKDAKGLSDEQTLGIYNGNIQEMADRLGLLNRHYADCYHRLAMLYFFGVREHLNNKVAIQMIGPDGVEWEEIKKDDITPERRDFEINVEASNAQLEKDLDERKTKLAFITNNKQNTNFNQKVLAEMEAEISGFGHEEIRRMLDVQEFGDEELMSECARDIQQIIGGYDVKPNELANVAYKQKMVDFLRDKTENVKPDVKMRLVNYIEQLDPIVVRNMVRKANEINAKEGNLMLAQDLGMDPNAVDPNAATGASPTVASNINPVPVQQP